MNRLNPKAIWRNGATRKELARVKHIDLLAANVRVELSALAKERWGILNRAGGRYRTKLRKVAKRLNEKGKK